MEGHAYLCSLVDWKDDALLQVEPIVCAYGNPQQAKGANSKHAAQQRQCLPATYHTTASTAGGRRRQKGELGERKKEKQLHQFMEVKESNLS